MSRKLLSGKLVIACLLVVAIGDTALGFAASSNGAAAVYPQVKRFHEVHEFHADGFPYMSVFGPGAHEDGHDHGTDNKVTVLSVLNEQELLGRSATEWVDWAHATYNFDSPAPA